MKFVMTDFRQRNLQSVCVLYCEIPFCTRVAYQSYTKMLIYDAKFHAKFCKVPRFVLSVLSVGNWGLGTILIP